MRNDNRIRIQRTEGEWEEVFSQIGSPDLNRYLQKEIEKLRKKFTECKECVTYAEGAKIEKCHYTKDDSYEFLNEVAKIMKKPVSTVVDELIINPLLTRGR